MPPELTPDEANLFYTVAYMIAIGVLVLGLCYVKKVFKNSKAEYYKQK